MSEHAEILRQKADSQRKASATMPQPLALFALKGAEALEAGANALSKLSSPDYVVVKREDAEKALARMHEAGREEWAGTPGTAIELRKDARALLGLSDSEGT